MISAATWLYFAGSPGSLKVSPVLAGRGVVVAKITFGFGVATTCGGYAGEIEDHTITVLVNHAPVVNNADYANLSRINTDGSNVEKLHS